ncbi:MAG: hypothetical protein FOGNACKC_00773 [Anaerolineae bacterium]|nr:hypothetical protein [Anaerolineae bacterium]
MLHIGSTFDGITGACWPLYEDSGMVFGFPDDERRRVPVGSITWVKGVSLNGFQPVAVFGSAVPECVAPFVMPEHKVSIFYRLANGNCHFVRAASDMAEVTAFAAMTGLPVEAEVSCD